MPQQKTRTNSTLACVNCQWRHVRCEKLPQEDNCTNCRKYNRLCIYIPGNKRGPKPHRQNSRYANLQLFSNTNPSEAAHTQYRKQLIFSIGDSTFPMSGSTYTQYQLTPNIDNISYLIPGVIYTHYQEQLTSNIRNSSHSVSETIDVQNKLTNQSASFFVNY
ncbi:hypothetical protein F8M41_025109 [Gigaspora margarita]|uniref:Zn(2)-C6 fungal-type domain-containing protein n=1 Tax=Gigaspora margarita TaxID=4874 RepID=A0A8H3XJT7_GIGMA|nr:hypothetical protein F8M41_025109 [Gigaspora margarita]